MVEWKNLRRVGRSLYVLKSEADRVAKNLHRNIDMWVKHVIKDGKINKKIETENKLLRIQNLHDGARIEKLETDLKIKDDKMDYFYAAHNCFLEHLNAKEKLCSSCKGMIKDINKYFADKDAVLKRNRPKYMKGRIVKQFNSDFVVPVNICEYFGCDEQLKTGCSMKCCEKKKGD